MGDNEACEAVEVGRVQPTPFGIRVAAWRERTSPVPDHGLERVYRAYPCTLPGITTPSSSESLFCAQRGGKKRVVFWADVVAELCRQEADPWAGPHGVPPERNTKKCCSSLPRLNKWSQLLTHSLNSQTEP